MKHVIAAGALAICLASCNATVPFELDGEWMLSTTLRDNGDPIHTVVSCITIEDAWVVAFYDGCGESESLISSDEVFFDENDVAIVEFQHAADDETRTVKLSLVRLDDDLYASATTLMIEDDVLAEWSSVFLPDPREG